MNGILAVVSHPDDETFGCGGTLALHAAACARVRVLCLTRDPPSRSRELEEACMRLGIGEPLIWDEREVRECKENARRLADVIVAEKPRVLITHLPYDYHADHRATYGIVKEAVEWAAHTTTYKEPWLVERLLLMEINTLIPQPGILVDVSSVYGKKEQAVECYPSQTAKFPWGYYEDWTRKKAELRGVQAGCRYAEAFQEETLLRNSPFYPEKSSKSLL